MANMITACRIVFSVILLWSPVFSPAFYGWYVLAGMTDMIDGAVARRSGADSDFGAKFDTAADIIFVAAAAYKLFPLMEMPRGIWSWIGGIAVIKVINIISGLVMQKQFVSVHTVANKATGFLLFVLPLTLAVADIRYSSIPVCTMATFAAIQEGHFIRTGRTQQEHRS